MTGAWEDGRRNFRAVALLLQVTREKITGCHRYLSAEAAARARDLRRAVCRIEEDERDGIASKFLSFPDEGRRVLEPRNGELWHRMICEWLAEYLEKWRGSSGRRGVKSGVHAALAPPLRRRARRMRRTRQRCEALTM